MHCLVASLVPQTVERLPAMQETGVWSLGQEDSLEKEMATQSTILAWKIPWREEPGRLRSMGSQRVGHDWATSFSFFTLCTVYNSQDKETIKMSINTWMDKEDVLYIYSEGHLVVFGSLRLHWLYPARLLCPWNSPGKNTGVGCHALLQGIFPTPRDWTQVSGFASGFFTVWAPREAQEYWSG